MNVILLNSPIYREHTNTDEEYLPSLGLCYIATHLNEAGIRTKIIDCVREHLGISEIFQMLISEQPDYLGMNIFSQNLDIVKEITEKCPIKTSLIIGGPAAKFVYREILKWDLLNPIIIILGESELILPDIVANKCRQEPIYSSQTKRVYQVNFSSEYFPQDLSKVHIDRSLLKNEVSINHYGQQETVVITSRGCIYDCAFCGAARSRNCESSIRYRPISDIKCELEYITSTYPKVSSIRVLDDLFLRSEKSVYLAAELFNEFINISWRGMAHILTFLNKKDLLMMLYESKCKELFIGVESGSDNVRKRINKAGTTNQVIDVISNVISAGIDVKIYLMYGFPDETYDEAEATYELAKKLACISQLTSGELRTSVFQFRPYHGTKLYDEIIKSGKKIDMYTKNEKLNVFTNRSQFNFQSGNFSKLSDDDLNMYILKTQRLTMKCTK